MLSIIPQSTIAILIGTSEYAIDSGLSSLPSVKNNIEDLYRILTDPDFVGIPHENVIKLLDLPMSSAITQLAKNAKLATDTLIVYYAGHGLIGENSLDLYLTAHDSSFEFAELNAISIDKVKSTLSTSSAKRKILILDCCYSGRAVNYFMSDESSQLQANITEEGVYAIAATPPNSPAIAPPSERHTAFTGILLSTLEHGIQGGKYELSLEEIFKNIESECSKRPGIPRPRRANFQDADKIRICYNQVFSSRLKLLRTQAELWNNSGKNAQYLLTGEALNEAQEWIEPIIDHLRGTESEFIKASQSHKVAVSEGTIEPVVIIGGVVLFIIVIAFFCRFSSIQESAIDNQPYGRITTGALNVRKAPSVSAPIIDRLQQGQVVDVIANDSTSTWVKINITRSSKLEGWVSAQYISLSVPITIVPVNSGFIYFQNRCANPLRVAISYRDISDAQRNEAWWQFDGNENSYLVKKNGDRLTSYYSDFYLYAETTDGSNKVWKGDEKLVFDNQTLATQKLNFQPNDSGDWVISLTCNQ